MGRDNGSLNEFLARFELPIAILQDEEALVLCTRELVKTLDVYKRQALMSQTERGDEIIAGRHSHIITHEVGGAAQIAQVMVHPIDLSLIHIFPRENGGTHERNAEV